MINVINGLMTGLLLIIFIGIWIWAWSSRNKQAFDSLSKLPLEENLDNNGDSSNE